MSILLKVSKKDVVLKPVTDIPRWCGSNLAQIFGGGNDEVCMSAGIHEIFACEVTELNPVTDLLYILEGEIEVRANSESQIYQQGDFAYLTGGVDRTYIVRESVKLIYVTYPSNWQAS